MNDLSCLPLWRWKTEQQLEASWRFEGKLKLSDCVWFFVFKQAECVYKSLWLGWKFGGMIFNSSKTCWLSLKNNIYFSFLCFIVCFLGRLHTALFKYSGPNVVTMVAAVRWRPVTNFILGNYITTVDRSEQAAVIIFIIMRQWPHVFSRCWFWGSDPLTPSFSAGWRRSAGRTGNVMKWCWQRFKAWCSTEGCSMICSSAPD